VIVGRVTRVWFLAGVGKGSFLLITMYRPMVKQPECEADNTHPSSAKVTNPWSYTSTPLYIFMVWYVVKHKNSDWVACLLSDSVWFSNGNQEGPFPNQLHCVPTECR